MNFNSLSELYSRLKPALEIRVKELNNCISEKELWDCLTREKWTKTKDLSLSDMVTDIFNYNILKNERNDLYE